MDEDGFVEFTQVYPNPEIVTLDVRLCVPTTNINNKVDLVIVRGYDPPPVRYCKDSVSVDWLEADSLSNYMPNCRMFATEAWRSYKDPVLETRYKDGVENLYELQAFEQLVGYVIDFDGEDDPTITYSFSDTTIKNVPVAFTSSFTETKQICDDSTGVASIVTYKGMTADLGNFSAVDIYGEQWPLFLNVQGLYAKAYNVVSYTSTPTTTGHTATVRLMVEPTSQFVSVPNSNWYWELTNDAGGRVHLYYRQPDDTDTNNLSGNYNIEYSWAGGGDQVYSVPGGLLIPNLGSAWLTLVTDIWAAVELDRPSVHVVSPDGGALDIIRRFNLSYRPIIVKDEPAPVAYTFGGTAQLVDHTLDLYDSDPSTVQPEPSTLTGSMAWLQTQTTGRTIDISLPFCDASECKRIASTIFDTHNEEITSYNLVCGPSSEPKLGARVEGLEGRINRISYSYTDGSAYNINVTVGPTFLQSKSWSTSIWQRKTEDVSRPAIITWAAGDGVNYRVKVQGMGVYPAINKTLNVFNVGEKVSVTIHNNPMEV